MVGLFLVLIGFSAVASIILVFLIFRGKVSGNKIAWYSKMGLLETIDITGGWYKWK